MQRTIERNLLRLVACEPSTERNQALTALVTSEVNWSLALQLAYEHGMTPILQQCVSEGEWKHLIPEATVRELRMATSALAMKSAIQYGALAEALTALRARGVEAVTLKGAALGATLYPVRELRPFHDIDLLCRSDELERAHGALQALGYELRAQGSREVEAFHTVYAHPTRPVVIELHEDLLQLGLPLRDQRSLWEHLENYRIYGESGPSIKTLDLEHLIVQLCVHLHTHGYGRLIWFKDLDLLARQRGQEVNWRRTHEIAESEGIALSLRHALLHTHDLLGTPLPQSALQGLRTDIIGEVAHGILWPRRRVLELRGKQRLRSLRFNPRLGIMGMLPSTVVLGRRVEKLARML